MEGDIAFEPPHGWLPTLVSRPALGGSSELVFDRWEAWRAADDASATVVSACVGLDVGTWTPEATPIALERLAAVVGATLTELGTAGRLRVERDERGEIIAEQTLLGTGDLEGRAAARTFLGFAALHDPPRLRGCFVLCSPLSTTCESAMTRARANSGFGAAPATSAPLRAVVFGVHHSRGVALSAVALFLIVGIVAVWTRPRPRRK